ncbi:lipoprotein [uncultured Draconibacterium sp.]|nr:lipoprotein [uncultured Draconibacterium sp.]
MKKILFAVIALLILASCTDEDKKQKVEIDSTYENVRVEIIE